MAKQTKPAKTVKSKLTSWLFNQPAKFAALSFGLMLTVLLIYILIASLIIGGNASATLSPVPVFVLLSGSLIFSIVMLIKWLPKDNIDRRSFIALDNGLTIIGLLLSITILAVLFLNLQSIYYNVMWMVFYSPGLLIFLGTILSLVYMYIVGIVITNMYAIYRRAITMGVPKWKALLSFPCSISVFWMPGYMLADKTNTKSVVTSDVRWFNALNNWVVKSPINPAIVLLITLCISLSFSFWPCLIINVIPVIVFGIWVWIVGADKFRKNIGGAFSTVVMIWNIVIIISGLCFGSWYAQKLIHADSIYAEYIQTTNVTYPNIEQ